MRLSILAVTFALGCSATADAAQESATGDADESARDSQVAGEDAADDVAADTFATSDDSSADETASAADTAAPLDSQMRTDSSAAADAAAEAAADTSAMDTAVPMDSGGWSPGVASCASGGQDAGSTGAEAPFGEAVVGLCRRALNCPSTWAFRPPQQVHRNTGTQNQMLLWRVWYYGWAMEAGTAAEKVDARDFLEAFFTRQIDNGHQSSPGSDEILNTSHYQLWANGMTCGRLLARRWNDPRILAATGRWWRGERALYNLLQRDGSIDAPGARFKVGQAGPSNLRDTIFAMLTRRALPGNAANATSAWWSQYYNVAAWTLRELQRIGDDVGGAVVTQADLPRLHQPLHVRVRGDDFVFEFPLMGDALQPIFWVARINGVITRSPYVDGTPTTASVPAPALTGASVTIVPGVP